MRQPRRAARTGAPATAASRVVNIPANRGIDHARSTASPTRTAGSSATFRSADISEYVTRPECFVWVALSDPTEDEIDEMAEEFGLHPLAVEDAHKGHQRPKIEEYDDSLFVVLHTLEPASDDGRRDADRRRGRHLRRPQLHPVGAPPDAEGLRRRPRPLRARARAAAPRVGLRPLRADGHRRRPVFPDPRRHGVGAGADRGADLRAQRGPLEHRGALRVEAEADGAEARGRPADGGDRQALRRPRAADLRRHAGILPRRLRSPAPDPRDDRGHPRNARRPRSRSMSA